MPEHLRSSDFSTPCMCLGVFGGACTISLNFPSTNWGVHNAFDSENIIVDNIAEYTIYFD